ncbi:hypothetical protein TraAM80_03516 [Trypanosoma rangeli]|uniref:Uncharacterized protein n=1 Tax=Trypanosoma rangeli TaxID=5698 RepID=A0A422NP13_TRYRA|nr:uncharacterized protein TraAM80_03516 [Trypanosoma rangeli]RNF07223.1 hypothetical protein TraAM80_03516 [Trypanosoma rangeli]|eukprot:RNF07223.1 hypothetical protein TraAM80_03516 [Trypanosoma rangeli]
MFGEILECVLEFIGSHSEQYGCSGAELLSFVSTDVLPYYGLADHATLRQMVLDLLLGVSGEVSVNRGGKTVAPSELTSGTVAYDQCTFCPSLALQERTLGVSLRFKNVRAAVNYACDNLVTGIRRIQNTAASKQKDRRPAVTGLGVGIRRLLREQWLRVLYVCGAEEFPLVPYLLPHFATPPRRDQPKRRLRPLEAYLERRRAELRPPRVAIDPMVARQIVVASPERRLVFEDAVHAIFSAHGHEVPAVDGRKMRFAMRRMLVSVGLCIVVASVLVKHRRHQVRVVAVDRGPVASDNDSDDGDDEDLSEASNANDDDGDDDDDDDDDRDESNEEEGGGDVPFCVDPSCPLALQVAKEAERRPLAVESVLPRVTLYDMRATENELHRFTRQFEERWGTIESTNVLSRHSKAFTRLLRPKGWGDARAGSGGSVASLEGEEAKLAKGVSSWAVNRVMEALCAAPAQALVLPDISRIVDRRTLGRVIPYLRGQGLVATTGMTSPKGRRIGVVAIAGVELTAEARETLMQSYLDSLSARGQKRQQSTVLLQRLPEPAEGGMGHSAAAAAIAKSCARSARLVAKVTMVRNGYSRVGLFRLSRVHVELWRVWCTLGQAPSTPMTLERVLQEMSLSSFCITVGVADVDVGEYVGGASLKACAWGTPIRRLPPSLQEHCRCSGVQPLLHSLAGLQSQGLVVSETSLVAYLDVPLAEVSIALAATALDGQHRQHVFCDDAGMTPQDTCRAVLKFWSDSWAAVGLAHESYRAVGLIRAVAATEPNLSNAQLIALARLLRMDPGILAEHILQRQGVLRARKRTLHDAMQVEEYERGHNDLQRPPHPRRRVEVNGATMAETLETILQSDEPDRGLAHLQVLVRRHSKSAHFSRYNPYSTRVHGSMQTLVQSIISAVRDRQSGRAAVVQSVVSPNFASAPEAAVGGGCGEEERHATGVPAAEEKCRGSAPHGPPSEALQDVLRMILLSDEAHYDAVAAKALLAQFPEEEQRRCIDWLLTFPSFRIRSGGPGRLPRIELSPILTFVPAALVTTVTHGQSPASTLVQDLTVSLLFTPQSNCQRWCVPPVAPTEQTEGWDLLRWAPRLVEQPCLNLDSLAEEIREQKGLGVLRLPRFVWPPHPATARKTPPPPGMPAANPTVTPERASASATTRRVAEPYPARGLLRPWQQLRHLELRDIPVDPPPSAEQVTMARAAIVTPQEGAPSPRFPSIFHHVDGSLHEFVWRSFLFAVYGLVHHSPGITEEQLLQRLQVSGLVSGASCRVALEFLKASLVIVARRVLVPCRGDAQSPFCASAATCRYIECYFCTIAQGGPWRIMEL